MAYTDKSLVCVECGATFTFTADEQQAFGERGYTNEPKRCVSCREARRSQRTGYSGGYGGGGSGSGGSGGYRSSRPQFTAVCAQCGGEAKLPFQPRGDRPVYCSDCFNKARGSTSAGYR